MSVIDLLLLLFSVHSFALASAAFRRDTPNFVFDGDVPYTVDAVTLAAALTCPNGSPTSDSPPVLLVHGTGSTGEETWGDGYVPRALTLTSLRHHIELGGLHPYRSATGRFTDLASLNQALLANGYTACYVTLPGRAMGDMQVSAQYVAYNLHMLSQLSGDAQTAVITHSQGGPDTQWALRFWPSTKTVTRAFVALSPDFAGIELLNSELSKICVGDLCQDSIWQQSSGSNYYDAMHEDGFGEQVPTTAVWTSYDGVVTPPEDNAQLPGAVVFSVQDICPARLTSHIFMTIDSIGFSFAMDALNNGGRASLSRVRSSSWTNCFKIAASHMEVSLAKSLTALFDDVINGFILGQPRTTHEPAVMAYAEDPAAK